MALYRMPALDRLYDAILVSKPLPVKLQTAIAPKRIEMDDRFQRRANRKPTPAYRMAKSDFSCDVILGWKPHPVILRDWPIFHNGTIFGSQYLANGARWTFRYKGPPIGSPRPSVECRHWVPHATPSWGRNHFRSNFKPLYLTNGQRWTIGLNGGLIGNRPRPIEWQSQIFPVTSSWGRNHFRSFYEIGLSLIMGRSFSRRISETVPDGRFGTNDHR